MDMSNFDDVRAFVEEKYQWESFLAFHNMMHILIELYPQKGLPRKREFKCPVAAYVNGKRYKEFDSMVSGAKHFGLYPSRIRANMASDNCFAGAVNGHRVKWKLI